MEVRNRMAELEENFNRLSENDASVNAHFDVSNWSHCLTNETGENLLNTPRSKSMKQLSGY